MKHFHASFVLLPVFLLWLGCTDNSSQHVPDYSPPTILLLSPANNSTATDSVFIMAFAHDNVRVARVEIYIDSLLVQSIFSPPWQCYCEVVLYDNNSVHTLLAKAYDVVGNIGSSVPISFTSRRTEQGLRRYDYWPLAVGYTWEFKYSSSFRDWSVYGIGKVIEASYSGSLAWEVISAQSTTDGFVCKLKQRFVGTASEQTQIADSPPQYQVYNFNIVDTTNTFDLTIGPDNLIKLSNFAPANWHYGGMFMNIFNYYLNVRRYPDASKSLGDLVTFSSKITFTTDVTLSRGVGPVSITHSTGGNSQRRALSAVLVTYTQRNERITSGKAALTH